MAKDVEHSAHSAMDYQQHEKTYKTFISMSKWGIAACIALLLGMMVGFFFGGGLFGGTLVFIIVMVLSNFIL